MHGGGGESAARSPRGAKRRSGGTEEVALQITSMADIFTILLVFLLKSYAVSATNISVGKDVRLPSARGGQDQVEAIKVEVHGSGITIEGVSVVEYQNFQPSNSDLSAAGTLPVLIQELKKERERQKVLASARGDAPNTEKDSKLLVVADKDVPYRLLKIVLASANEQDFTDYKLVVVQEE